MIKSEKDAFSERLKAYLKEKGVSCRALAYRSAIPSSTMEMYYSGKYTPTIRNLRKIVNGSGVSADFWVGVTDEMRKAV